VQQWAGYCLTGHTREHKLVFIHGPGGTSKSTVANTFLRLLADYACVSAMETFTNSLGDRHPEEIARLAGVRLVVANETEAGHHWRENRIKAMTGGDPQTAHFMRENSFTFTPQMKLLFVGNHAPAITNFDTAIARRFILLPFNRKPVEIDLRLEEAIAPRLPAY
jgi:putative DNA primase/helicase